MPGPSPYIPVHATVARPINYSAPIDNSCEYVKGMSMNRRARPIGIPVGFPPAADGISNTATALTRECTPAAGASLIKAFSRPTILLIGNDLKWLARAGYKVVADHEHQQGPCTLDSADLILVNGQTPGGLTHASGGYKDFVASWMDIDLPAFFIISWRDVDTAKSLVRNRQADFILSPFRRKEALARIEALLHPRVGTPTENTDLLKEAQDSLERPVEQALPGNEVVSDENEVRFRSIANDSQLMIVVFEAGGMVSFCNRAWLQFRGRSMISELSAGWLEGLHPDDNANCALTIFSALRTGKTYRLDLRLRRADGEFYSILCNVQPLPCDPTRLLLTSLPLQV